MISIRTIGCLGTVLGVFGLADSAMADYKFYKGRTEYILVTTAKTWDQAEADAVAKGGHLVQINDATENALILSKISGKVTTTANDGGEAKYVWIGGKETTTEGTYAWTGGTTFWAGGISGSAQNGLYQNWGRNGSIYGQEPDNYLGVQNRAAMGLENWPVGIPSGYEIGRTGQWNDLAHTDALFYVIERPISKPAEGLFAVFQMSHGGNPAGSFTCQLHYDKAPITVANFISLAEGTRGWIDAPHGRVSNSPFYNGLKCHRILSNFMIQGGDPNGNGSGGPGFQFLDEFSPDLRHDHPGVLSMANSGPNTNGSQFFVTVAETTHLNDVHTIFGEVVEGYESCVLPLSNVPANASGVPVQEVKITSITIQRLGAAAQAFNPLAQSLPTVTAPAYSLSNINPSAGTGGIAINQPARSLLRLYRTQDLSTWDDLGFLYLDRDASPLSTINIGGVVSGVSKQFFRVPIIIYPSNAIAPDSLAGRILTVQTTAFGPFTVEFFSGGGGTVTYEGSIYNITGYDHDPEGYGASIVIRSGGLIPLKFQLAYDFENSTHFSGRTSASYYDSIFGWQSMSGTAYTLTK